MFCVCDDGTVAPAEATLRHARRAHNGHVKRYPIGHFDIYLGEWFERGVGDLIRFLTGHVPTSSNLRVFDELSRVDSLFRPTPCPGQRCRAQPAAMSRPMISCMISLVPPTIVWTRVSM